MRSLPVWVGLAAVVTCGGETGVTFDGQTGGGGAGASSSSSTTSSGGSSSSTTSSGSSSSGSSTSTSSTSTSSTSSSSGGGAPPCDETPCKLTLPQCGCAPGDKCTIDNDERVCGAVDSQANPVGAQCTHDYECEAGSICTTLGGGLSLCHAFCDGNGDCDAPGGQCVIDFVHPNQGVTGTACTMNCDLVSSAGCQPSAAKCAGLLTNSGWATVCVGAGTGTQGTSCNSGADCASGFGCINTGQGHQCLAWCMVATPSCTTGVCSGLSTPLMIGAVEYGVCY